MARPGGSLSLAISLALLGVTGCLQANPNYEADEPPAPRADAPGVVSTPDAGPVPLPDLAAPPVPVADAAPPLVPDLGGSPAAPDLRPLDLPPPPPDAGPLCATGEEGFAGHCYRVIQGPMTYPQARQACKAKGALPVSIGSSAEQAAVYALIPSTLQVVWIGLVRTGDGKKAFAWESGEPLTYTNWAPGEPNNSGWQEECAEIWGPAISNLSLAGGWNDDTCWSLRGAVICERVP